MIQPVLCRSEVKTEGTTTIYTFTNEIHHLCVTEYGGEVETNPQNSSDGNYKLSLYTKDLGSTQYPDISIKSVGIAEASSLVTILRDFADLIERSLND